MIEKLKRLPGVRKTWHFLVAAFGAFHHGSPSKIIYTIGVTGTKGKTTTVELINAILETAGKKTALISSQRKKIGARSEKNFSGNSMPGRGRLQKFLKEAVEDGCGYAVMEVTSQGAVQHRHRFIHWNAGLLTNLSPEHIESHGSFENYRKAKLDFLRYVAKLHGKIFLNKEDEHFRFYYDALMSEFPEVKIIQFSRDGERTSNYVARTAPSVPMEVFAGNGSPAAGAAGAGTATLAAFAPKFLLSDFNMENIAAAVAVARDIGIGEKEIDEAITNFKGVSGRMEFVKIGPYTGVVDYAHTPDSLEAAYKSVKPLPSPEHKDPKLICILGAAGGGRDKWKRPEMGKIAAEYCDEIIITNEDPYDEEPLSIMREVRSGILGGDQDVSNVFEIEDRREAIKKAVGLARAGDVIIGTGKGSEDWIHIARGKKIPWNERREFEEALSAKNQGK